MVLTNDFIEVLALTKPQRADCTRDPKACRFLDEKNQLEATNSRINAHL
jgi:hypothetical protein